MKFLKWISCGMVLAASILAGCSPDTNGPEPSSDNDLTLSVSKTTIAPDNHDKAVFTVKFRDVDVTSSAVVIDQNGKQLRDASFTSAETGTYSFTAKYTTSEGQELESNQVTVTVGDGISISVDSQTISIGQAATFTVIYKDLDVSSSAVIKNLTTSETLESNVFEAPSYVGEFQFQATYSGMTSDIITITVEAAKIPALLITQSKARVQEGDQVDFEVFYEGNDVTSQAKIFNITAGEELSGNSYVYSGRGSMKFQAEYNGEKSQIITVSTANFYKKVLTLKFTSVQCGNCVQTTIALDNANQAYPGRMVQVACYTPAMGEDELSLEGIMEMTSYFESASYLPSTYYDYDDLHSGVTGNAEVLAKVKSKAQSIAYAGISATSLLNGSTIDLTVNVTAARDKEYYLAVFVLEDGIVAPQASGGDKYIHNHVLRGFVTDDKTIFGDNLGDITANQQVTKKYSINAADYNSGSCALACFVLYKDTAWHVANAISVPMVNGFVDYNFEG